MFICAVASVLPLLFSASVLFRFVFVFCLLSFVFVGKVTNKIMFVIFTCMAVVTTLSLVGYIIFEAENDDKLYYLCYNYENAPVPLFQ